ncbi:Cytochrome c OS=Eoetvoesiella caeni OX=645616 GN=DFR37_1042 PE=4 SV=1 [Eoetvoesiella caeni]
MSEIILLSVFNSVPGRFGRWLLVPSAFILSMAMFGASPANAQAIGLGLAQANSCVACHTVEKKRVGPAFRAIADRFAGKPGAQDYLAQSIRSGGGNRWGAVPMPAQPQVTEEEAQALAAWILSLADNESKPSSP